MATKGIKLKIKIEVTKGWKAIYWVAKMAYSFSQIFLKMGIKLNVVCPVCNTSLVKTNLEIPDDDNLGETRWVTFWLCGCYNEGKNGTEKI